jgi:hypothetical protein
MTRDEIIALLDARDPLAAAAPIGAPREIAWTRDPTVAGVAEVVRYGAGTTHDEVADRLIALAGLPGLQAVVLVPGDDTDERPGSWGVEDLLVTAVARRALPDGVAIRNDWAAIGGPACQAGASFGATEWVIPADDDADPDHLAEAIGARAVAR